MTTEHFFLCSPAAPLPERLGQAFAQVQALTGAALKTRLRGRSPLQFLVWLSSADASWAAELRQILQNDAGTRVVLLSAAPDVREGLGALNDGVRGYTHAYAVPELLQEVALVIEHGGLWVGPDLLHRLVGATHATLSARVLSPPVPTAAEPKNNAWATLSAREAQVARTVAAGRSNKEVADLLFISERTVKAHLSAVFEKLHVRDRLQLVLHLAASADPGRASKSELQA